VSSLDEPERSATARVLSRACSEFAERDRRLLATCADRLRDGVEALEAGDGDSSRVDRMRLAGVLEALSKELGRYRRAGCEAAVARELDALSSVIEPVAPRLRSLWEDHDIMRTRPHGT